MCRQEGRQEQSQRGRDDEWCEVERQAVHRNRTEGQVCREKEKETGDEGGGRQAGTGQAWWW